MAKNPSRVRRHLFLAAVTAVITIIVMAGIYLTFVPVDLTSQRERIEEAILERSTHRVNIERVEFRALPTPRITFHGARLMDGGSVLLSAASVEANISLTSLVWGPPTISKLSMRGAKLTLERSPDGLVNAVEYAKAHPPRHKVVVKSFDLVGGLVRFTDGMVPDTPPFEISSVGGTIGPSPKGVVFDVWGKLEPGTSIKAGGEVDIKTAHVRCGLNVTGAELARFTPYIEMLSPGTGLAGTLDMEASIAYTEKVEAGGSVHYSDLAVSYPRALDAPVESPSGSFAFDVSKDAELTDVRFTGVKAFIGEVAVTGTAALTGPERSLDAYLSSTPATVGELISLIPAGLLSENAAYRVRSLVPKGGTVTLDSLNVKGTLDDVVTGRVLSTGTVEARLWLEGIDLGFEGLPERFTGINGDIILDGPTVRLKDFAGAYGKSTIEKFNAVVTDLTETPAYELTLRGDLQGAEVMEAAKRVAGPKGRAAEVLATAEASGRVIVDVDARGRLTPAAPESLSGTAVFKDASIIQGDLPMSLTRLAGRVDFDPERLEAKGLHVSDGKSLLAIDGVVDGYLELLDRKGAAGTDFDLQVGGALSSDTVLTLAGMMGKEGVAEGLYYEGLVPVSGRTARRDGVLNVGASFDLTPAYFIYKRFVNKGRNYPLKLNVDFKLSDSRLSVRKAQVDFGSSLMVLVGHFSHDLDDYIFALGSDRVLLKDLDDVSPFFKGDFDSKGLLRVHMTGLREAGARPAYRGEFNLEDASFSSPHIASPLEGVNASGEFRGNTATIVIDGMKAGSSSLGGTIDVLDVAEKKVRFDIYAPTFDTSDILVKLTEKERIAKYDRLRSRMDKPAGRRVTGTGVLRIGSGRLWKHKADGFFAEVTMSQDTIEIHPAWAKVDDGNVTGELWIYRDLSSENLWKVTAELKEVELERFFQAYGAKKKILTGGTSGMVSLTCRRWAIPFRSCVNGEMSLQTKPGKLYELNLFSKIFSLVNIFSIDELFRKGLQFKTLTGDFTWTDGVMRTDDLLLESDSMRMSAVGSIDIVDVTTDSILAMHPFVTIDKVISSIPLAGWVLTGEEKSTVSLYFRVKGPLKDPDINPMPVEQMGKKVFGIFQRLLELPFEMIMPGSTKKKDSEEENGAPQPQPQPQGEIE